MKSYKLAIIFFYALSLLNSALGQNTDLNLGENEIENSDSSLIFFKLKMDSLKNGSLKKVKILQIGDSHIQPDNFSGETRRKLQTRYGNGGRGLVFPYTLAKTNGPKDFTVTSTSTWINSWIINYPHKFKIGLPGIGIQSVLDNGSIDFSMIKDSLKSPYITAFAVYSMEQGSNGIITLNNQVTKKNSGLLFDTICIQLTKEQPNLKIDFKGTKLTLHAVYFENEKPGIIYNSIGVAGAKYKDYVGEELFSQQLPLFNPDLVILSLGTNESFDSKYNETSFALLVDSMINTIKKSIPNASILITLPSENYRVKSGQTIENSTVYSVSTVLKTQAQKHNCAIWDLYTVMGGKGSMLKWHSAGLVNQDHIHYLRKGYNLQGQLLYNALKDFIELK